MREVIAIFVVVGFQTGCDLNSSKTAEPTTVVAQSAPTTKAAKVAVVLPEPKPTPPIPTVTRTAISCEADDRSEIYIIDDVKRKIEFFGQDSKTIKPLCTGTCNWEFTDNRISFENPDNGFITGAVLDRVTGQMTLQLASQDIPYSKRTCSKIPMPKITSNKF